MRQALSFLLVLGVVVGASMALWVIYGGDVFAAYARGLVMMCM